jgi:hypothetical protein
MTRIRPDPDPYPDRHPGHADPGRYQFLTHVFFTFCHENFSMRSKRLKIMTHLQYS